VGVLLGIKNSVWGVGRDQARRIGILPIIPEASPAFESRSGPAVVVPGDAAGLHWPAMATVKRKKKVDPRQARRSALQARLREAGVDALLITNPVDIRYLTGFIGDDSWAVVPSKGRAVAILTDARFEQQVRHEAPGVRAYIRRKTLTEELTRLIHQRGYARLGLQPGHVTLALRKQLVKHLGAKAIKPIDDGLLEQRSVKDAEEIRSIRKAIDIQQRAFEELRAFVKPGVSEAEAAAFLEFRMRSLGADGRSFPTIMAADANAALPHAIPGRKKMRKGGLLLIDWGAKVNGYCGDLTRVVAFGSMKRKMREVYQVVLDAQQAGIEAARVGTALADVDRAARRVIEAWGYGKQFGHSLGHGLGLDIHEQPTLSARSKGVLAAGQVVTVEPGVYLPGVGGVRIEDDVLVTEKGPKVLSDLPKGLDSAII